jgi:hypothetical protein
MAKKFINGENLVYSLGLFEQQMKDLVEKITDFAQAQDSDIDNAIKLVKAECEEKDETPTQPTQQY